MIDRELLWKAWPDGFLARRGLRTVGDWECVMASEFREHPEGLRFIPGSTVPVDQRLDVGALGILSWNVNAPMHTEILENGDLLPNVDPTDVATWAWLLDDLVRVAMDLPDKRWWVSGWAPAMVSTVDKPDHDNADHWVPGWGLSISWGIGGAIISVVTFIVDTDDPALALVLARIKTREGTRE